MKKLLFCAAMVAAMSMAFVACGGSKKEDPKEQLVQKIEKICADHDVNAFNALEEEMMKYSEEDFTEKQLERIEKAVNSYMMKEWERTYPMEKEEETTVVYPMDDQEKEIVDYPSEEPEDAYVAPINDNAALCEKLVREFEAAVAAGDYERAYQISMEAEQKINPADFTQDQVERIMRAGSLIPEDFINSKM